jgi:hypothetical protein
MRNARDVWPWDPTSVLLPSPLAEAPKEQLWLEFNFGVNGVGTVLGANATQRCSVHAPDDSAFCVWAIHRVYLDSTGAPIAGDQALALIRLQDAKAGKDFFGGGQSGSGFTYIENVCGNAGAPFWLPWWPLVGPGRQLVLTLVNLEAVARQYSVVLSGTRIYRHSGRDPQGFMLPQAKSATLHAYPRS